MAKQVYWLNGDQVAQAIVVRETDHFYFFQKWNDPQATEKEGKRRPGQAIWKGQLFDSRSDALAELVSRKEALLESALDSIPVLRAKIKALSQALIEECQAEAAREARKATLIPEPTDTRPWEIGGEHYEVKG